MRTTYHWNRILAVLGAVVFLVLCFLAGEWLVPHS